MSITIDCFKAYDVRGRIPDQLNADVAYRIGNATVEYLGVKSIVLCRDIRHSSDELSAAVARGLAKLVGALEKLGLLVRNAIHGIMVLRTKGTENYTKISQNACQNQGFQVDRAAPTLVYSEAIF